MSKQTWIGIVVVIIVILGLLIALGAIGDQDTTPSNDTNEESVVDENGTSSSTVSARQGAQSQLVEEEGVEQKDIVNVQTEAREWPNVCLGLAEEGESCAQVITPGYRVIITTDNSTYVYRTDQEGSEVRLEEATAASQDNTATGTEATTSESSRLN